MMRRISSLAVLASTALMFMAFAGSVLAQSYPTKLIKIVVPFPPGGATDVFARMMAQPLSENVRQQVIVENRGGGNAVIGSEVVAKAAPDGYTLLFNAMGPIATPGLYQSLPFDVEKDFTPITLAVTAPNMLAAHPSLPANTLAELIALAKAKPGQLNGAISFFGGSNHLTQELFMSQAGIKMETLTYKGAAPALNDLLGGHANTMFNTIGSMAGHLKTGKLKALAVSTRSRIATLPNVPAMSETLPGFETASWFAIWGPGKMPKELVARINAEIVKVLHAPEVKKRYKDQFAEAVGNSPEEFAIYERAERQKWAKVIQKVGAVLK
ncbi:MAG: tripartite tricarboxylate transporter substrate binding protein [Betaproteobacteria bacterium]|nr:tripartite tricarboxylate transporter substrate binding protein [Betaproteobacteria bacterium]